MTSALKQIEDIVDRLSVGERVELLKYLAPRLMESPAEPQEHIRATSLAAWERMKKIGQEMALEPVTSAVETGKSSSDILSQMRR